MRNLKPLGYLLVFVVPALMPIAAWLATVAPPDLAAWFPMIFLFVLLPAADYALGRDASNPADATEIAALEARNYYRVLTLACVPIQLGVLAWSIDAFTSMPLSAAGKLGWLLSQGVVSGGLAINVAHELIHKAGRLEPFAGGVLLASVGYHGFKVEHVRGHHVHVSTPQDASSAPYGASVYGFITRSFVLNTINAWRLEAERLRQKKGTEVIKADITRANRTLHALITSVPFFWRNELVWWTLLWLAMGAAAFAIAGFTGTLFFFAQGLLAALTLEIINYVEHYGLERRRLPDGRYERTTHLHSWNSNYLLSNLMLFQLQRHSDHHENARRRYQALVHHDASPQLPGGYAAMFVLALVPPLWHHVMDPKVRAFHARTNVESIGGARQRGPIQY